MDTQDQKDEMGALIARASFEPSPALAGRILLAVERRRQRMIIIKAIAHAFAALLFIPALWGALQMTAIAFYQSGTAQILSLVGSNFKDVVANWSDFVFSILESLPIMPLVYVLASFAALIFFAVLAASNVKKVNQLFKIRSNLNHA